MEDLQTRLVKSIAWLERYKPDVLDEIATKLNIAQDKIISIVQSTQNKTILQREINKAMQEAFSTFATVLNDDVENISELAWNTTASIMTAYVVDKKYKKFKDVSSATKKKILSDTKRYQGFTLQEHLKYLESTQARKLKGLINIGFSNGEGIDTIARNIRNSIGGVERNQLRTLTRTVLLENLEEAKNELLEEEFSKEITYWVYSSVLDNRTTPYCWNAHGYKTKDKSKAKYKPKTHYNCRSMWTVETDISSEFEEPQRLVQFDGKKVNHRDGTTSTKFKVAKVKTIPSDVKGVKAWEYMDDKYKKDYLGAKRYKLYKEGKADFKDMIDISRNKLIPINTLKQKLSTI